MKKILISLCLLMVSLGMFAQDAIQGLKKSFSEDNRTLRIYTMPTDYILINKDGKKYATFEDELKDYVEIYNVTLKPGEMAAEYNLKKKQLIINDDVPGVVYSNTTYTRTAPRIDPTRYSYYPQHSLQTTTNSTQGLAKVKTQKKLAKSNFIRKLNEHASKNSIVIRALNNGYTIKVKAYYKEETLSFLKDKVSGYVYSFLITSKDGIKLKNANDTIAAKDIEKIYEVVDVDEMPHFTGGRPALISYLSNNVKYPAVAQENIVEGRVTVSFIVESDGSIADAKIVRSTAASPLSNRPELEQKINDGKEALSEEALRVVSSMPKWVPGKLKGKGVCVKYNIPITFELQTIQEEEPKKDTTDTLNTKPYNGTFGEVLKIMEVADQPSNINKIGEIGKIYEVCDEMPQFPGGTNGLMEWLSNNVEYPVVARENGVQGRVIVSFIVERDGSITNVRVVQGVDPFTLDKEAVRLVLSMPKWTPGKIKGQQVRVQYRVPIAFGLR